MAALHLDAIARVDGVEAVALTDVDAAQARSTAARHGVGTVHPDLDALTHDPAVDIVAVCAPPAYHAQIARAVIAAGRAVFVEKPLVLDLERADELVAAASAAPFACVGFNLRLHRQVLAARRALADGTLGRLLMLRTHWTAAARPPGWRSEPEAGGGALWEMGIHHLDLWRHLTGAEPVDVRASGDDSVVALSARTPSGTLLATTIASGTSDANDVELVGERGRLTLTLFRGDGPHFVPVGRAAGGVSVRVRAVARSAASLPRQARAARRGGDYLMSFAAEWESVRDAVRDGGPPHATLADGRAAVVLTLAAEAALRERRAVPV